MTVNNEKRKWPNKCTFKICFNLLNDIIFDIFQQIEVDELIIPKTVLFVFVCIFAVVAFVFLVLHWMEPVYSPALTSRKTYAF